MSSGILGRDGRPDFTNSGHPSPLLLAGFVLKCGAVMILITGGTGFIGSHLVEAVCARGEPLRCLIRRDSSKRHPFALPAEAEIVFGDLVSGEGLSDALEGVGTVIHLAGVTKALSTSEFYSGNAGATENLARAVAGRAVRFVYVSSLAAIGPSTDGTPVSEDAEPHPITHYGRSKLEGERIARALVPDAVIVRPAVVYGPRDTRRAGTGQAD